ncbi:MAG TPA: galactokinase [Gemmatimonadales bacterium]|jgi:galactokinase
MSSALTRIGAVFSAAYRHDPALVWSAPGRVNLIGEHTDYNGGFVLPFALPHRTAVGAARSDRPEWTVVSEEGKEQEGVTFGAGDLVPGAVRGWAGYVAGVVWALREAGVEVPHARLAIASDVPIGAGLSSSAALECAVLAALADLAGAADHVPVTTWPALAQRAENGYVGVPCGIMDQAASTLCRRGHALFLDCRTQAVEQVPFDLAASGLAILVADTHAPHRHSDNEYAARRATCEAAARALGVPSLREVDDLSSALETLSDDVMRRRVRHVVTENERVLATVKLLRSGAPADIGPLLNASHVSLRGDYEVTVAELDVAVDAAMSAGALGARMTGGGFGGCIIALVRLTDAEAVAEAVEAAFAARRFGVPSFFTAIPSDGVSPDRRAAVLP